MMHDRSTQIVRFRFHVLAISFVALLLGTCPAAAGNLSDIFEGEPLVGLDMGPLGPALANTVASTYPVASASSSVTYVFNPATEAFERRTRVLGPIIGERAETIGRGQINIAAGYSYVSLDCINGDDLDDLVNKPVVDGQVVAFEFEPGEGVFLDDGRFTNFLPVLVKANIDVEAQILSPAITYGVTPDFDVNLTLPLVRTFLRVRANTVTPDPRLPQFALPPGDPNAVQQKISLSDDAVGVGDLLLRAKYVVQRGQPFDLAAGLGLSFPTGDDKDFAGTGTTRVQPTLIASRVFADRVEPLLNVGVDINADDVDRSIVRWAVGATGQIVGPLTGAAVFLGRHELSRQSDKIEPPFFFQIERNDIYDVALGFRYLFAESGVIAANVIVPLNDDGLRADVIPTVGVEYAFTSPW